MTPTLSAHDTVLAYIRTYVPYAIGAALAWVLLVTGLDLTGEFQLSLVTFTVAATTNLYYWFVRVLEVRFPGAGVFLGWASRPEYLGIDNLWASLVRTAFPTVAAFLVGTAAALISNITGEPIVIDHAGFAVVLVAVFQAVYYALSRELIRRFPSLSWLLGSETAPQYVAKG